MANQTSLSMILSGDPLPKPPPIGKGGPLKIDDAEMDKFHRDLISFLRRLMGRFITQNMIADPSLREFEENGFIEAAIDKDYTLVESCVFANSVDTLVHKLVSGSCNLAIEVDGVALTGTGDASASATQGTFTFDTNAVTAGQRIVLVVSGSATPVDLAFTLKRTKSN